MDLSKLGFNSLLHIFQPSNTLSNIPLEKEVVERGESSSSKKWKRTVTEIVEKDDMFFGVSNFSYEKGIIYNLINLFLIV